ncbi:MAG TPA: hypothetical protein VF928_12705 [Usitatibacteraceae bacterium]
MATIQEIDDKAAAFSKARDHLVAMMGCMQTELEFAEAKWKALIEKAADGAISKHLELSAAIAASPEHFVKPRTRSLHGLKYGLQKLEGKVEIADEDKTIRLIYKHLPEKAEQLIKFEEKPIKDALRLLPVADLAKVGATLTETGDVVTIKTADKAVEKMVTQIITKAESEAG